MFAKLGSVVLLALITLSAGCATTSENLNKPIEPWILQDPSHPERYEAAQKLFTTGKSADAKKLLHKLAREGYPPALKFLVYTRGVRGGSLENWVCETGAYTAYTSYVIVHSYLERLAFYGDYDAYKHYWMCFLSEDYRHNVSGYQIPVAIKLADFHAHRGDFWSMTTLIGYHLSYGRGKMQLTSSTVVLNEWKQQPGQRPIDIEKVIYWFRLREAMLEEFYESGGRSGVIRDGRTAISSDALLLDYLGLPLTFARYYENAGQNYQARFWARELVRRSEFIRARVSGPIADTANVARAFGIALEKNL